jgi:hypothetical protein
MPSVFLANRLTKNNINSIAYAINEKLEEMPHF